MLGFNCSLTEALQTSSPTSWPWASPRRSWRGCSGTACSRSCGSSTSDTETTTKSTTCTFSGDKYFNQPGSDCFTFFHVYLSVCLSVRPHLSPVQYYVMRYYATAVYYCANSFWRFVGQDTASKCRFVLPRQRESGRQPWFLQLTTANRSAR